MDNGNPLCGFQFQQKPSLDNDIGAKRLFKLLALVSYRDPDLPSNRQAAFAQIFGQQDFIHGFQQPWPHITVETVAAIDSLSRKTFKTNLARHLRVFV